MKLLSKAVKNTHWEGTESVRVLFQTEIGNSVLRYKNVKICMYMTSTKNFPENALLKAYNVPTFCYNCDINTVSYLPLQSSEVAYCNSQSLELAG